MTRSASHSGPSHTRRHKPTGFRGLAPPRTWSKACIVFPRGRPRESVAPNHHKPSLPASQTPSTAPPPSCRQSSTHAPGITPLDSPSRDAQRARPPTPSHNPKVSFGDSDGRPSEARDSTTRTTAHTAASAVPTTGALQASQATPTPPDNRSVDRHSHIFPQKNRRQTQTKPCNDTEISAVRSTVAAVCCSPTEKEKLPHLELKTPTAGRHTRGNSHKLRTTPPGVRPVASRELGT